MRARAVYEGDEPDVRVIRSTFRAQDGPVGKQLDIRSRMVMQEAQRTVPVRTGTLLASIRREYGTNAIGAYWQVHAGVAGLTDYLGYILNGTPPHIIRPRRRKALRFIAGGRVTFATKVQHPGTRKNNFLENALHVLR
jgi:hypothetical protein